MIVIYFQEIKPGISLAFSIFTVLGHRTDPTQRDRVIYNRFARETQNI